MIKMIIVIRIMIILGTTNQICQQRTKQGANHLRRRWLMIISRLIILITVEMVMMTFMMIVRWSIMLLIMVKETMVVMIFMMTFSFL